MLWDFAGRHNTEKTARTALKRAKEIGIEDIIAATNTGYTVDVILEEKKDIWPEGNLNIVAVTHQAGFREPGGDELGSQKRKALKDAGVSVLTTTHLFANIERNVTRQWGGLHPGGIVSATLRTFGQGTKVCFEIAVMAKDAALIPHDKEIMTLGGTGGGADTAIVMKPAHSHEFFDTEVKEVVCRPRRRQRKPE